MLQVEYSADFWMKMQNSLEGHLDISFMNDSNNNRGFLEKNLLDLVAMKNSTINSTIRAHCSPSELRDNLKLRNFTSLKEKTVDILAVNCIKGKNLAFEKIMVAFRQLEVIIGKNSAFHKIHNSLAKLIHINKSSNETDENNADRSHSLPSVSMGIKVKVHNILGRLSKDKSINQKQSEEY